MKVDTCKIVKELNLMGDQWKLEEKWAYSGIFCGILFHAQMKIN